MSPRDRSLVALACDVRVEKEVGVDVSSGNANTGAERERWRRKYACYKRCMLRDKSVSDEGAPTGEMANDWQAIHRALRSIAKRRARLDSEEARWLREAVRVKSWRRRRMRWSGACCVSRRCAS